MQSFTCRTSAALSFISGLALLALMSGPLAAQNPGTIRGRVLAATTARPLAGAQIVVEGTGRGSLSNSAGEFLIVGVPPGTHTVQVRMLGYQAAERPVTVAAGQSASVSFELRESAIALDEVVVTGEARATRRREVGTAVASIETQKLETAPIQSFSQLIQARAPGVNVLPGGGKSGQGTKIVLRGPKSLSRGIQPVVYVDGVRIDNSSGSGVWTGGTYASGLDDINPADIERVEIVKGAAAATLFGTEAATGVIQIFTKKGRGDGARWTYNGTYGRNTTPNEWWDVSIYSDWFYDNFVDTGQQFEQQLSVNGQVQGFNYYVSGTMRGDEGILPNNGEGYKAFRANMQINPRENLVLNVTTGYSRRTIEQPQDANNIYGYALNGLVAGKRGLFISPEQADLIEVFQNSNRVTGGFTAEYSPIKNFTNRLTLGADIAHSDDTEFQPYAANRFNPRGRKENYRRDATTLSLEYVGVLTHQISSAITSTFSSGVQAYDKNVGAASASGRDFPTPGPSVVGAAAVTTGWEFRNIQKQAGGYVQEQLGFGDRFFLTGRLRADGHSSFGTEYNYQWYPGVHASLVVSEYGFWPQPLGSLRLRAAYGTAGQQPGPFDAIRSWEAVSAAEGVPAVIPENLGNPNLGPEVSREFEGGFDMGLLDNRVGVEFTYYHQQTSGALLQVPKPPSQGFLQSQLENVAGVRNRGIELGVNATLVDRPGFRWAANINASTNDNEVTKMPELAPEVSVQWTQKVRQGFPIGGFWGERFSIQDGTLVETDTAVFIGPAFATRTFNLGTDLTLGNRLTLYALLDHAGGHFVESSTVRWLSRFKVPNEDPVAGDRAGEFVANWCRNPADATIERMCGSQAPRLGHGSWVMPADFWKLREVSLSYSVPERWTRGLGFNTAMISLSGRNLWRSIDDKLLEAEASYNTRNELSQQEYFVTPIPRQVVAGIRLNF